MSYSTIGGGFESVSVLPATGNNIQTGQADVSIGATTGADLTAYLGDVADITNIADGDWTELLSVVGNGKFQAKVSSDVNATAIKLTVAAAEDSGDALRAQILVDGAVVFDDYEIGDGASPKIGSANYFYQCQRGTLDYSEPIPFSASLTIRAARKGTFTEATSLIQGATYKIALFD